MSKRVLITGAAGFLGSHLCDRFIKEGFHVLGMDNLITGDLKNIEHLFKLQEFEFYHHDVSKFIHVPGELDYILHFASPASPIDYLKIPIQTLKVGSLGTHNCLGLAMAKGARILVASTSEVYGDPLVHPQTEDYWGNVNPIGPRGVYDEAKRFQEAITMAYHTYHGLETRIVRDIQYVRSTNAIKRRSSTSSIYRSSVKRRGFDGFWRWKSNKIILLCRRLSRRHL
jgi:dTDP-glucose 4,6-dehydratase